MVVALHEPFQAGRLPDGPAVLQEAGMRKVASLGTDLEDLFDDDLEVVYVVLGGAVVLLGVPAGPADTVGVSTSLAHWITAGIFY
mgnify:FL=1